MYTIGILYYTIGIRIKIRPKNVYSIGMKIRLKTEVYSVRKNISPKTRVYSIGKKIRATIKVCNIRIKMSPKTIVSSIRMKIRQKT